MCSGNGRRSYCWSQPKLTFRQQAFRCFGLVWRFCQGGLSIERSDEPQERSFQWVCGNAQSFDEFISPPKTTFDAAVTLANLLKPNRATPGNLAVTLAYTQVHKSLLFAEWLIAVFIVIIEFPFRNGTMDFNGPRTKSA